MMRVPSTVIGSAVSSTAEQTHENSIKYLCPWPLEYLMEFLVLLAVASPKLPPFQLKKGEREDIGLRQLCQPLMNQADQEQIWPSYSGPDTVSSRCLCDILTERLTISSTDGTNSRGHPVIFSYILVFQGIH